MTTKQFIHSIKYLLIACCLSHISACNLLDLDGKSDDTSPLLEGLQEPETTTLSGTFVVPKPIKSEQASVIDLSDCSNIPSGYLPLLNATINIVLQNEIVEDSATNTDTCGKFEISISEIKENIETAILQAESEHYKTLTVQAKSFTAEEENQPDAVASTISKDAQYVINGLQKLDSKNITFSITDSIDGKALIQTINDAITIKINSQTVTVEKINSLEQIDLKASSVLTLDASGSMSAEVYDDQSKPILDENNETFNRMRLTARAAHQFIAEKNSDDEIAIIPFSSDVNLLNASFFDNWTFIDTDSNEVALNYSASGFTQNTSELHFAVDFYNLHSPLWSNTFSKTLDTHHISRNDQVHLIDSYYYPWDSGTKLEDSINQALAASKYGTNPLKAVFVMTDGDAYFNNLEGLIDEAKSLSIPVHSLAISEAANTDTLQEISEKTGGSFKQILDISTIEGVYSALQSTIKFAYIAELSQEVISGDTLTLEFTLNGETTTRSIEIK